MNAIQPISSQRYKSIVSLVEQGFSIQQSLKACGLRKYDYQTTTTPEQRLTIRQAKLCSCRFLPRIAVISQDELMPDLWNDGLCLSSSFLFERPFD